MNENLDKLSLAVDGEVVIHPCVEIMALSMVPKADGAAGYVRFHEAFARRYGDHVQHYRLNDTTKWKRFQAKDRLKVRSWFSDARTLQEPLLGITMHTQPVASRPKPPLFEMFFDHAWPEYPRGMFRIALPPECIDNGVEDLCELVDDALAEFPLHWGTAGYAFYWKGTDTTIDRHAEQWLGRHLVRHPGLATGDLMTWGLGVEDGVANIGWLTFVGDKLVGKLGGSDALRSRAMAAGLGLRSYRHGVALQAGSQPELGDVNRKDTLPSYHEVGRILEPVFAPDDLLEGIAVTGLKDPDGRLAWLRRFLP